jgi:hypothetical protein
VHGAGSIRLVLLTLYFIDICIILHSPVIGFVPYDKRIDPLVEHLPIRLAVRHDMPKVIQHSHERAAEDGPFRHRLDGHLVQRNVFDLLANRQTRRASALHRTAVSRVSAPDPRRHRPHRKPLIRANLPACRATPRLTVAGHGGFALSYNTSDERGRGRGRHGRDAGGVADGSVDDGPQRRAD